MRLAGWIALIVAVTAIGFMWASPAFVLRSAARLWVVSDSVDQADAIVVLGGGLDIRPAAAADLYKRGISRRVLVAKAESDQGRHASLIREALLQDGVPPAAIVEFGYRLHSTYGEARGVLEWAKINDVNSVIIPIDIFFTRRARWIFNHELGPAGIRSTVHAVTPKTYSVDNWWQHEAGLVSFRNELIKFAYYRLRY
jgi:uncharacterized SAM-binding protein YcdF (DUF218 family)